METALKIPTQRAADCSIDPAGHVADRWVVDARIFAACISRRKRMKRHRKKTRKKIQRRSRRVMVRATRRREEDKKQYMRKQEMTKEEQDKENKSNNSKETKRERTRRTTVRTTLSTIRREEVTSCQQATDHHQPSGHGQTRDKCRHVLAVC